MFPDRPELLQLHAYSQSKLQILGECASTPVTEILNLPLPNSDFVHPHNPSYFAHLIPTYSINCNCQCRPPESLTSLLKDLCEQRFLDFQFNNALAASRCTCVAKNWFGSALHSPFLRCSWSSKPCSIFGVIYTLPTYRVLNAWFFRLRGRHHSRFFVGLMWKSSNREWDYISFRV